jgi:hypothetical protein
MERNETHIICLTVFEVTKQRILRYAKISYILYSTIKIDFPNTREGNRSILFSILLKRSYVTSGYMSISIHVYKICEFKP